MAVDNAPSAAPVVVNYPLPVSTGGVQPIAVTCTHPSGGGFALGTTDVICSANDSATPQRRASCVFSVTVKQSFAVGATKFLAFGDSITAGEVEYNDAGASVLIVEDDKAYPTVLRDLLTNRYPQQTLSVRNAGSPGEPAGCTGGSTRCGANRISDVVRAEEPHVLLLLQGVVDLAGGGLASIEPMVDGLKYMIRDAKRRGVGHVFLATLLPEKRGSRDYAIDFIVPANDEIRDLAIQEDVHLVDAYAAFVGKEGTLIGKDGLHPTPEGYQALAGVFFDAIKAQLETVVTTPSGAQRVLRLSPSAGPHIEIGPQFFRPTVRTRQR